MLVPGTVLGGCYKIIRLLGIGGFGETYEAEDLKRFNCLCVVKRVRPQINFSVLEITRRLFDREARTLRELGDEHEQIPQLYAYFEENQDFYLVQEYIEGATITEIILERTLSEFEVIDLLKQVLKVLDFIHNHNNRVIHRDIKPANLIRRSKDNKIVLIDFGAVKQKFQEALNDPTTVAIGTNSSNLVSPYKKPQVHDAKCTPTNRNKPNVTAFKNETYPLTNRLFVIYNQNNPISKQVGTAYIKLLKTAPRRKVIEEAGFVAI